jgi:hypothetical protein
MRRLMKFMHTMGSIGLMGAMACLLVLLCFTPAPSALPEYALMRRAMAGVATWVFLPSLGIVLISGLLAIAINRAYHNAGWAWVKLVSGVLVFEWGLVGIQGPMREEAELSTRAMTQPVEPGVLAASLGAEWNSLWAMLVIATANVVLGIWRPRLTRIPD